jgi:putative transposase
LFVNTVDAEKVASDAGKLRVLESENAKLRKILAEAHLDIHTLKGVFGVKR